MKFKLAIFLIFVLAFFLRLWNLDKVPPSLNWDEVSLGYNSYSILKTGADEWGNTLPLSFRAFGDYKLPGYVYLDMPFISMFGLNEWGVRLPSAVLGVGLVILTFLTLKHLSDLKTAIWGAFISAILPWTIVTSRIALEAQLALFLTALGFYLFVLGLKEKKYLIFSAAVFGLTIFSYNSSRVVTSVLVILLGLFYFKELKKFRTQSILALLIFLTFFILALPKALLQDSSARYRWTKILDEGAINSIEELRRTSNLPPALARLNYNKVTYFISETSINYISHFTLDFLFLKGGSNYQFSVPGSGLTYPILLPFLLLGLIVCFKERKKWQLSILAWFFIAPLPAAITRDSPHALRSLMMIPPVILLCSIGINFLMEYLKRWKFLVNAVLVAVLLISLNGFWSNYTGDYIKNYSWSWQYGYKEAVDYIKNYGSSYNKIYFTKKYGEPHEFILFYTEYDSAKYRNDPNLLRYHRSDWYWVDSFDKYIFLNDWEVKKKVDREQGTENSLLITSPGNYPSGSKILETINFLDGKTAFDIVLLPQVQ